LAEGGEWDGSGQASSAKRLDTDQDNLRAALTWFAANDRVAQLRLAGSLGWFWIVRAQNTEGRQQLEAALATSSDRTAHRAKALRWLAHLSRTLGDVALARRQLEEALTISEEFHEDSNVALTLLILGTTSGVQGDLAASRTFYERALAIYERIGDRTGVARMQHYLGIQAYLQGDLPRAQSFLEASLPGLREAKDAMFTAQVLALLGMLAVDHHHLVRASSLLAESLSISEPMGNQFAITLALDALAGLAAAQQRDRRALELAGAASAARDAAGIHVPPHLLGARDRWLEPSRRRLGKRSADQAWEQGRRLPVHEALAYALDETAKISRSDSRTTLTRREKEIAELVSQGLTNRQIADRLVLSVRTAEGHVERIRDKLGVRSRAQIAAWFVEKQVVPSR
jgi:non-specific serine/threonine protein kinase